MSKKVYAEMAVARRNWLRAETHTEQLYWVLDYLRNRILLACRLGDSPTAHSWQRIYTYLELIFLSDTRSERMATEAWKQDWHYSPQVSKGREYLLNIEETNPYSATNAGLNLFNEVARVTTHPHCLAESISTKAQDRDDEEEYFFSWEEFSKRIDAFEARMKEEKPEIFARIRSEDFDMAYGPDSVDDY